MGVVAARLGAVVLALLVFSCGGDDKPGGSPGDEPDPSGMGSAGDGSGGNGSSSGGGSGGTSGGGGTGGGSGSGGSGTGDAGTTTDGGSMACGDQTCVAPAQCEQGSCTCPSGYTADGQGGCDDVDECATDHGGCDALTSCTNSPGSHSCGACPSGYTGTGADGCDDVDECATSNGGCDALTTCTNTAGARACGACPSGYSGTGEAGCTDVDECATSNGGCGSATFWTCANNTGAAPTCTDIDECATNNGGCGSATFWTCGNNTGAAPTCTDIDECASATHNCDTHATCSDHDNGFTCTCNAPAYTGSGTTCTCNTGYSDVGAGVCKANDGTTCGNDTDCVNAHCVSGVCCASGCTTPPECKVAAGATCAGGATCVYANENNGTACDDDSVCSQTDTCQSGVCTGSNFQDCSDGNVCTTDTCDAVTGCENDGTGVTISCAPNDLCAMNYVCRGNPAGTCAPTVTVNCAGSSDECNLGYCDPADGQCKQMPFGNGQPCDDGDACTNGTTCNGGDCNGGSSISCDDGKVCTTDGCDPATGCTNINNTAVCSDGNHCTEGDQCQNGACVAQPKDCSVVDDQCVVGMCDATDGSCDPIPVTNGIPCSDGNTCTAGDSCQSGNCTPGTTNACGAHSLPLSTPGACTPGSPNVCGCEPGYDSVGGACEPNVNECDLVNSCNTGPCDPNATCSDPSPSCNDRLCDCNDGYMGDGLTCVDIDECMGNPCGAGRGSCVQGAPGTYSCTCNSGFTEVGGTCVCDLDGLYAIRIETDVSWPAVIDGSGNTLIRAGSATTYSWALRDQSYDAGGDLTTTTIACGGTTPDLCGTGENGQVVAEAYAQFLTNQMWGTSTSYGNMPTETLTIALPNALATQPFVTPETVALAGISLTTPSGSWPAADDNMRPGGTATQTNGATWINNHDGNTTRGVTSYAVPPGGIGINDTIPDPPFAYAAISPACPVGQRSYNYWPVGGLFSFGVCDEGAFNALCRVTEFHLATRAISALNGTFTSCDLITGDVTGPNPDSPSDPGTLGEMRSNVRIGGCRRRTGGPGSTTTTACSEAMWDFVDDQPQTQQIDDASFIIKRVPASATDPAGDGGAAVTCAEVRGMTFP